MQKCITYARVSTLEQQQEGYSIDDQLRTMRSYARRKGLKNVKDFPAAESAKNVGREKFHQMLSFLDGNPNIQHVICDRIDRLTRNLLDLALVDQLVMKSSITFHFVSDGIVYNKDSGLPERFMYGIMGVVAKGYSDGLSLVVKKNMKEMATRGTYPGRVPRGYLVDKNLKSVVLDESCANTIRMAFQWYATGRHSLRSLSRKLFSEGIRRKGSGKQLSEGSIERILKNEFYYGMFRWADKLWPGNYEPLISKELFDQVQIHLKRFDKSKERKLTFPYRGLLKCGYCGCNITAQQQKRKYVYYNCTEGKGKCPQKYYRESVIAERLGESVKAISIDREAAEELAAALTQGHKDEREYHKNSMTSIKRELSKLQDRLTAVYEDKLDCKITDTTWQNLSEKYNREIQQLEESLARHEEEYNKHFLNIDIVLELAQTAYSEYIERTDDERRVLLDNLLSKVVIKDDQFIPMYREPFDLLAVQNGIRRS